MLIYKAWSMEQRAAFSAMHFASMKAENSKWVNKIRKLSLENSTPRSMVKSKPVCDKKRLKPLMVYIYSFKSIQNI